MHDRLERISALFHAALRRPPEERPAFLRDACGHDPGLEQEIESLLRLDPAANSFLETPAGEMGTWRAGLADPTRMLGRQLGPYQIVSLLGVGGMGEVYRARDLKLARDVAIKILPSQFTTDEEHRARFAREARILATLSHPNIGVIHGVEEVDGGTALVLELVDGPTLADRLAAGPLSTPEALTIALQIGDALHAAHVQGIVHRDLKPSNVVVQTIAAATGPSLRVRVLDFGLSKLTGLTLTKAVSDHPSAWLTTVDGRIAGTPAYMSPEQVRGQPVDERADIWAFGCILFEMFAGRRVFDGDTAADAFARILEHEPEWAALRSDTPAPIRRVLERCLQKDVRKRMEAITEAVQAIANSLNPSVREPIVIISEPMPRNRTHTWVFAGALVALAAGTAWLWPIGGETAPPALVRLTSNPAEIPIRSGHISPDGRYLAFADSTGLQVRSIDGGQTRRIADTKDMNVYGWTPESSGILASRCDDSTCVGWAISLVSEERHRTGAVWSHSELRGAEIIRVAPDGQRLLRLRLAHSGLPRTLSVDPMNGTPPYPIASGDDIFRANWSADGKRVFIIKKSRLAIESVPAEGGTSLDVFRAPTDQIIADVVELADRTLLIAMMPNTALPSTRDYEVWKLETNARGIVLNAPRRLTWTGAGAQSLTASSNGRVSFYSFFSQGDVYVADVDVSSGVMQTPRRFTINDSSNSAYAWTPDSSTVLLASNRNGTRDIFKQRLDRDIADPFISGPADQLYPGMTDDGRWVFYVEGTGLDDSIMKVPLTGGVPAMVVPHVGQGRLQCAGRAGCVLLESKDGSFIVSRLDPFDGRGKELARIPARTAGFRLLPDGDNIAYIVLPENGIQNRIRIISFSGKPPRDIVVDGATFLQGLSWLPSNSGFLTSERSKLLLAFENGDSRVLWSGSPGNIQWAVPSPDEKHVAINITRSTSNIWMLSGF